MDWQIDVGTAYDLWMSLHVLHYPQDFGLRRPWAAGVRARLPEPERRVLAEVTTAMPLPFPWVAGLKGKKSASDALAALAALPPAERLTALFIAPDTPTEAAAIWREVAARGAWRDEDLRRLHEIYASAVPMARKLPLEKRLDLFAHAAEVGEGYLRALSTYRQVFFAEEEERIAGALNSAAAFARRLLESEPFPKALERLTQGLSLATVLEMEHLVLAPSYWSTPLVVFRRLGKKQGLLVFGARPQGDSLVPGEGIPAMLQHSLRALDNPTRLRILRYLAEEPMTPSQLARRLRLRLPTVLHHLHLLRLAGLVSLNLSGGERLYAARMEHLDEVWDVLRRFLRGSAQSEDR